ncbi:MAG: outer membrane lipoprotein carrier protein LolA [Chloroflexi bacterium]|nr:outer membrane lipoprotein carrier protein LolA [Chloroflexota bacterium]
MRIRFFILFLLLCWLPSMAAAVELNDVVTALETPFRPLTGQGQAIDDFQANFFQESHIASIERTQRGQGVVSFRFQQRPNSDQPLAMFRWEYREPLVQQFISDGQTMWAYEPENRQVVETDISEIGLQQNNNPIAFLNRLGFLSQDFEVSWADPATDQGKNYILEFQPREEPQFIRRLLIVVARKAVSDYIENDKIGQVFPILATTVYDLKGNRTSIEFAETRINQQLSRDFFYFERPEGVEVVRPTGEQLGF